MLKKLEVQSLRADISALDRLLKGRTNENDPLGFLQLNKRRDALTAKLAEVVVAVQHGFERRASVMPVLREALAQTDESFCDDNCTWRDHHPDCALARQADSEGGEL